VPGIGLDGRVELHAIQHGYCGLVEVDGGAANLCCWARADALRLAGGTPQHFLTSALRQNACLHTRLQAAEPLASPWSAVSYTYRRRPTPLRDGMWNVGDSAAMVAPLTGDGMGMGLRSAELAATILQAAFRQELTWEQALAEYDRRWRRAFLPRLRWGRRLEAMLLRPRLAGLARLALNLAPWLMDAIYSRTRGITPVARDFGEAGPW
jgi:2-polyprenyl-6-methoxyphenol hydroxylase-like FAD-dependent oxidoreductase